jgi:hypothetical protein
VSRISLTLGAKRMIGKKKTGATEWRALRQFALNVLEIYDIVRDFPYSDLLLLQNVKFQIPYANSADCKHRFNTNEGSDHDDR